MQEKSEINQPQRFILHTSPVSVLGGSFLYGSLCVCVCVSFLRAVTMVLKLSVHETHEIFVRCCHREERLIVERFFLCVYVACCCCCYSRKRILSPGNLQKTDEGGTGPAWPVCLLCVLLYDHCSGRCGKVIKVR